MGRGLGFQPQQGYGYPEDSWGSDHNNNNYHNPQQHHPTMHINNLGGTHHGMFHDTIPNNNSNYGNHGYDHYGHGNNKLGGPIPSQQFPNGGPYNKFNSNGHHGGGYSSEEYEEYNEVAHNGAGKLKVDEIRYERHNYPGGHNGFHANPYGHGGHKGDWIAKGV